MILNSERMTQAKDIPPIECHNISFCYEKSKVINNNISLNILKGEIYCILGPNGAGKTTLIRQITGELSPSSGTIINFWQKLFFQQG